MLAHLVRLFSTAVSTPPPPRLTTPPPHPQMMYGTAWKKDRTCELVLLALQCGFRGIDTACQPKHYDEAGVGAAVAASGVARSELYLQTKYTPLTGQDPARVPYDANAEPEEQVSQSVAASLRNLQTDYIDCLVLHSPLPTHQETLRVWRAMERHVASGEVRRLGISNCYDAQALSRLHEEATEKPATVQNRFVAEHGRHDVGVRAFCAQHGLSYQSFWTLTGNKQIVGGRAVRDVARKHGCAPEQAWYAFVRALGVTPLSGTTSEAHMRDDLSLPTLEEADVQRLQCLIG